MSIIKMKSLFSAKVLFFAAFLAITTYYVLNIWVFNAEERREIKANLQEAKKDFESAEAVLTEKVKELDFVQQTGSSLEDAKKIEVH